MINIIIFVSWHMLQKLLLSVPKAITATIERPFKRMKTLTSNPIRRGGLPRAVGGTKSQS